MVDRPGAVSNKWIVLLITSFGAFMTPFDASVVGLALPRITAEFQTSFIVSIWIPMGYLLALTSLLVIVGRLSDIYGRKDFYNIGIVLFTLFSALCGLAGSMGQLIFYRILQGAGSAFISANSTAIVTDAFPPGERGKALGINVTAVYLGLSLGPIVGGSLVHIWGWRSIFFINVPIGLITLVLSQLKLPQLESSHKRASFDWAGSAIFASSLAALLIYLTFGQIYGFENAGVSALAVLSAMGFAAFFLTQIRTRKEPLLDLRLFTKNRLFAASNTSALLNYMAMFGAPFLLSYYMQGALAFSPGKTGIFLVPMPFMMMAISPMAGWLSDRVGSRFLCSAGMILISFSLYLLSRLTIASQPIAIMGPLFIMGLGMGLFSSPNNSAVMGSVSRDKLGVAAGTIGTMRFLGQALSLAILSTITESVLPRGAMLSLLLGIKKSSSEMAGEIFVKGIGRAFLAASIIAATGVVFSLIRGPKR